jgi:hypothetical protein
MEFKRFFSIIIFLIISVSGLLSQKVKFDDDAVLIDKVKKYDFLRTKKGGLTGLSNAELKDLQGNMILEIKDTSLFYKRLPNELGDRVAVFTNYIKAPKLGKTVIVPEIISYNIRKDFVKALEELGFFKDDLLDEQRFEQLCKMFKSLEFVKTMSEIDTANVERFEISKIIENKFSPLLVREPGTVKHWNGKIQDGKKDVGKFVIVTKGSYSSTYKIIDSKGNHVADLSVIPRESRANVRFFLQGERRKWFYFKTSDGLSPPTPEEILNYFFNTSAKYVVDNGYL